MLARDYKKEITSYMIFWTLESGREIHDGEGMRGSPEVRANPLPTLEDVTDNLVRTGTRGQEIVCEGGEIGTDAHCFEAKGRDDCLEAGDGVN